MPWMFDDTNRRILYRAASGAIYWYNPADPADSTITASPEFARMAALYFSDQPGGRDQAVSYFAAHNDEEAKAAPVAAGAPDQGIRYTPDQITAQVERVNSVLDYKQEVDRLAAEEQRIKREMLAIGANPDQFFGPAGQRPAAQQGQGGLGLPDANVDASAVLLDPAYVRAYTAVDKTALRADLMGRVQRLQAIQDQFANHKQGAGVLQNLQTAQRGIDDTQRAIADSEARANVNPANDQSLQPVTGPNGQQQWVHPANVGRARELGDLQRGRSDILAAHAPEGALFERQQQYAGQKDMLPPHVRAALYGEDFSTPGFATYAQQWNRPKPATFTPPMLPHFAGGGTYTDPNATTATSGTAPPAPYSPGSGNYADAIAQTAAKQDAETAKRRFPVEQARADLAAQRQIAEQRIATEMRAIEQERAQIETEFQSRLTQLGEQRRAMVAQNPYIAGALAGAR